MFKKFILPLMFLLALPAWAGTTYYIGSGAFGTDFGLAGLTSSGLTNFTTATGVPGSPVSLLGVTFATASGFSADGTAVRENNVGTVTVSFAAPVYAVLLNLTLVGSTSTIWCVNDGCDGGSFVLEFGKTFPIGAISTDAITSFTLRTFGGNQLKITDMLVGTIATAEAPEPASMLLLGGSLLGVGFMAQRRKRRGDRRPASGQ